jgi:hypothetical protein
MPILVRHTVVVLLAEVSETDRDRDAGLVLIAAVIWLP